MFCKNCGKKSDSIKKFCTNCGASFSGTTSFQEEDHIRPFFVSILKKINVRQVIWAIVVLVVVVAGIYSSRDDSAVEKNNNAVSNYDSGDSRQAINQLREASEIAVSGENKINSLKNLAYIYSSEDKEDLALDTFKEALLLTSAGTFDYYLVSGEIADLENKPNAAQLAYSKAYQINPDDFQINNALALFYLDLYEKAPEYVDYKKALGYAQKAYEQSKLLLAKKNLALAYYFNEDYDQAISLLSSIDLSKEPNYAYFLGLSYAGKEDSVNAKIYLNQAIAGGVDVPKEVVNYINSN